MQHLTGFSNFWGAPFAAFVFLGVILMVINPLKPDMRPIVQKLWIPLTLAIGCAVGCGVLQAAGAFPRPMSPPISDLVRLNRFQVVWAIHAGLYAGGMIGVAILWWQIFSLPRN